MKLWRIFKEVGNNPTELRLPIRNWNDDLGAENSTGWAKELRLPIRNWNNVSGLSGEYYIRELRLPIRNWNTVCSNNNLL